jgi:mutator protein MutT
MKRVYPSHPLVGVGAVIFSGNTVLLARRNQEPGKGIWSLPGGLVEVGETLQEALKRELKEEVSIAVEIGGLLGVFDRIIKDDVEKIKYHYVIVDYWGWIGSGDPRPGSDVSDVKLVPLEKIETLDAHKDLKEAILKAALLRSKAT